MSNDNQPGSAVVRFDEPQAIEHDRTGGKGANLGRLTAARFPVPPGFVVTTDVYRAFVADNDLGDPIASILGTIDYSRQDDVEQHAAEVRALFDDLPIPATCTAQILDAYDALGGAPFVAVRSSGTAEDLADTSFAGQHDTYLHIDRAGLLDAIKRCWASMWSGRAVSYRNHHGIAHESVALAVVVQTMIDSEVSGVMFTANPISTATDEVVINASWGLGEAVVSGIVTPDLCILSQHGPRVKSVEIGSKAVEVVRDPETGVGTIERETDPGQRRLQALDDAQLIRLARIGMRVQEYYDGMPQDIEWGYAGGRFYLLQSRDITGVEYSWDEDLDPVVNDDTPEAADDTVWTRAWGDSVWPGAITPFFYSQRSHWLTKMSQRAERMWGVEEAAKLRMFKYHKGRVYFNTKLDASNAKASMPPVLRQADILANVPVALHPEVQNTPFSYVELVKLLARIKLSQPDHGLYKWFRGAYDHIDNQADAALGLSSEEIAELTDKDLIGYFEQQMGIAVEYLYDLWTGFFLYFPAMMSTLVRMVEHWYKGTNPMIVTDLVTGLPRHTKVLEENLELWKLSEQIRGSETLRQHFDAKRGRAFFETLGDSEDEQAFKTSYAKFVEFYGHRGHADRDIRCIRRVEDPGLDYVSLTALLTADSVAPAATMSELIGRRQAAEQEMVDSIKKEPFGTLKAEAFKAVQAWLMKLWVLRDDERFHLDRISMSKRNALKEIARRLEDRGVIPEDDVYFLSYRDVYALLKGAPKTRLMDAKIAARRRNWEAVDKTAEHPMFICNDSTRFVDSVPDAVTADAEDSVLRGLGTSRGEVTGIARIIPTQADLHRVGKGDILVTSATDPGWTPVFLVAGGVVLETGGLLAHGACISREYAIPAVQIDRAMRHISDGARITVNGDTGTVVVHDDEPAGEDGTGALVSAGVATGG